jgi:hypothetical protein
MKKLLVLSAMAGLFAWPVGAQENYATWSQSRTYILNTTAGGANVAGQVLNFPVLVRLGAADSAIFTAAKAGGADIRFDKLSGTHLPYQIENWDAAGRSAAIWVLMDTVKGNSSAQNVRMRWGNAGAFDSSSGTAVFDTAKGFKAVWHFSEGTASDSARDATANKLNAEPLRGGNNASSYDLAPGDTVGIIGRARRFGFGTGSNYSATSGSHGNYYSVPNSASGPLNFPEDGVYSVSAWVNVNAVGTSRTIASKGNMQYYLELRASGRQWEFTEYQGGTGYEQVLGDTIKASTPLEAATNNQWQHLVGVRNGTSQKLYWNGVMVDSTINLDANTGARTTSNFHIGKNPNGTDRFWRGELDEIRVAGVSRNLDWIKLEFENQKAAQSLLVVVGPPTALDYSQDTAAYGLGAAITPNVATVTGAVDSFTVAPALPAGLSLNKTTGAITGTPTAITAAANYVVSAINGFGTAKDTLRLSIVSAPPAINYVSSVTYLLNATIATLSPSVAGSVDSFTVSPALPAGLTLHKTSGAISGAPTAASAAANYVITAAGATGTGKDTVSITVIASEDYTTWSRHKTLWLNTTNTGANVPGTVLNFPVLVRFSTTDTVYSQMLAGAADLRFTKSNNVTRLPHQIETWDSAGKSAAVWVLVDSILGGNGTQNIRMHWGKAATPNLSSGPAVFDTSKGFRAVFHFSERTNDTAFNSTQYTFRGVPQRTATTYSFPEDTVGVISRARRYGIGAGTATTNNAGSYFTVNGSAAPLDFAMNGPYTLSLWAFVNETGTSRTMVSKSDRQYAFERRNTGADWEFAEHNVPLGGWQVVGSPSTAGVWTHLVGVRNNGGSALYVDGALVDTVPNSDATTTARITTTDLNIGRSPDGGTNNAARYYWRGMLDEVRVAGVSRSANWAKLEFENQKAAQTLVSPTQPVGILPRNARVNAHGEGIAAKALGTGMLFQLSGAPQGGKLNLMNMQGRTIWSGTFSAGMEHLAWNGTAANGQAVPAGIYLVRVKLSDKAGDAGRTLSLKVPYTP